MTIKNDFVLRQVADTWVVLPLGETSIDFNGMLTLNESGAMLWRVLEQGADANALVEALIKEYDVSREQALADVNEFLADLRAAACLES